MTYRNMTASLFVAPPGTWDGKPEPLITLSKTMKADDNNERNFITDIKTNSCDKIIMLKGNRHDCRDTLLHTALNSYTNYKPYFKLHGLDNVSWGLVIYSSAEAPNITLLQNLVSFLLPKTTVYQEAVDSPTYLVIDLTNSNTTSFSLLSLALLFVNNPDLYYDSLNPDDLNVYWERIIKKIISEGTLIFTRERERGYTIGVMSAFACYLLFISGNGVYDYQYTQYNGIASLVMYYYILSKLGLFIRFCEQYNVKMDKLVFPLIDGVPFPKIVETYNSIKHW